METVIKPYMKVLYNGVNITADITKYLLSLTYSDKVEGESDEVTMKLEDVDGRWRDAWYPEKGAKLDVTIGYPGNLLSCGVFEIDQLDFDGPPDTVTIKGLAAAITGTLRTIRSDAHEGKTLRQIAVKVAQRNGLTVLGTIPDVRFERVTQNRETDLSFLKRISKEYGCLFSVRGTSLVFTTIYELEAATAATIIDRLDVARYNIKDVSTKTYKEAEVRYHNPKTNKVSAGAHRFDVETYAKSATGDVKVIHTKAENRQQAELKAKAALHRANSKQQEGRLTCEGNPLAVAGNNFELTGFGLISGVYHIVESTHTIDRSSGYSTELAIKRVGFVDDAKKVSTKRTAELRAAQQQPGSVSVVPAKVEQKETSDKFTYTRISS